MTSRRRIGLVLLCSSLLVPALGCTGGDNCGNLLTVLAKVGFNKTIGTLTACEWKVLFNDAGSLATQFGINTQGVSIQPLTDDQAQAIVDFLAQHNIMTIDELIQALTTGTITINDVPPVLLTLVPVPTST